MHEGVRRAGGAHPCDPPGHPGDGRIQGTEQRPEPGAVQIPDQVEDHPLQPAEDEGRSDEEDGEGRRVRADFRMLLEG